MDDNPFPDLHIDDLSVLDAADSKVVCPSCGTKRRYFCYSCILFVNDLDNAVPVVKLPVKVDIIKHKQELNSKSTAIHAALLAKDDCHIYSFPDIPQYNPDKDVLVFPSDDCITVEQWVEKSKGNRPKTETNTEEDTECVRKIVFIDCTWNQIHGIMRSPQLADLPRVGMHTYKTKFWRPNGKRYDETCLATIEAIYYFLKEYHTIFLGLEYVDQYDNLLSIFKFMYLKIKDFHSGGANLKAYKRKLPD